MKRTRREHLRRLAGLAAIGAAALFLSLTRFQVTGESYGVFLTLEEHGAPLKLTDDLLLGERVVAGISLPWAREIAHPQDRRQHDGSYLETEWNPTLGRGIVRNHFADGTELVTLFSRVANGGSDGPARHGVFVGGSLPDVSMDVARRNESGMAFRDRFGRWYHVWCNANESVWDVDEEREIDTWQYAFLQSRVLVREPGRVVIESSHRISIAGVPVHMDRVAYFTAGEPYLELAVTLQNVGVRPVRFMFLYGDEPWVGTFGTSFGNLGWTPDRVFADESILDAKRDRAAGIVDSKSGVANFIAWLGENRPNVVYVSNALGSVTPDAPLMSNEIFIGTEWRGRILAPGEMQRFHLAVGMAERDPVSGRLSVPTSVFDRKP